MDETRDTVKQIRRESGATVVELTGEVDLHRTPAVHKALIGACEDQPRKLIVDLSEVRYLDSSGLGTLVEIFRRVKGYGGALALCGLSERVRSVFEITKLDRFFAIYATQQEALSA